MVEGLSFCSECLSYLLANNKIVGFWTRLRLLRSVIVEKEREAARSLVASVCADRDLAAQEVHDYEWDCGASFKPEQSAFQCAVSVPELAAPPLSRL
jgi:hypothetical protein